MAIAATEENITALINLQHLSMLSLGLIPEIFNIKDFSDIIKV